MSVRLEPFINNRIYHIFNKTIDHREIFTDTVNCKKFLSIITYYRSNKAKISFSKLPSLDRIYVSTYEKEIQLHKYFRIEILAYCLMPTHFHLLIKQVTDKGISRYIADILNSFTKYFNIKYERIGPIFLPNFKAVKINNESQFMHAGRYVHLNPYSSGLCKSYKELENYQWSSLKAYICDSKEDFVYQKDLMDLFNKNKDRYKRFVLSNAEHQKTLETVKYAKNWIEDER